MNDMCDVCFKHATKNTEITHYRIVAIHPTKRGESTTRTMHLCLKCAMTAERRVNVKSIKAVK